MRNKKFISKIVGLALLAIPLVNSAFSIEYVDDDINININTATTGTFYIKGFYNVGKIAKSELNPSYLARIQERKAPEEGKEVYTGYTISKDKTAEAPLPVVNLLYYLFPQQEYEALYNPLQGGGGAIGYYINDNFKIEAEGALGNGSVRPQNMLASLPTNDRTYFLQDDKASYFYTIARKSDEQTNNDIGTGPWPVQYQNKGINYLAGMLNIYYDFDLTQTIKPYIGAGAGLAKLTFKARPNTIAYATALQGKIGLSFALGNNITPYLGYRILSLTSRDMNLSSEIIGGWDPDKLTARAEDWSKRGSRLTAPFNLKIAPYYLVHNLEVGLTIGL